MATLASAGAQQPPDEDLEGEEELLGPPPQPKVSPYYSVARQRARQQIRNARTCVDTSLRAERLAAALEAAEFAGLPEQALQTVQEELLSAEGAARALGERPAAPEMRRPRSRFAGSPPLRPVTPVALFGLTGSLPVAPGTVALLLIRDDGLAELRDAYNPRAETAMSCRAFDTACVNLASAFAMLQDHDRADASRAAFDHSALQDLIDDCGTFQAIIAVVDPLRLGGQVLCSHFLSHGPQGSVCGVIAAVPSTETPAPFSGPSYGALSVLLCLGSETLGLGGRGWVGGGVFGRRLALVDRAAAYSGGWPSVDIGRLAFRVVGAAAAAQAPGGSAGSFLFGGLQGSAEELAMASSVRAWLHGAAQASHTSQAWIEHFTKAGVSAGEHNDGPMWLHAAEKAGRWPGGQTPSSGALLEGEDGNEESEVVDDAPGDTVLGDGNDETADAADEGADGTTCAPEVVAAQEACVCGPPQELPAPPPLIGMVPAKYAVPFGAGAMDLLDAASKQSSTEDFTCLASEAGPEHMEGGLPQGAEVLIVLDLACPQVLAWSSSTWISWASACSAAGGVLVAAALLPADDAPDIEWHVLLLTLHALIQHFGLVIWLQQKAASFLHLRNVLLALLDPAVSLGLLTAHLVPFQRLHFCVAYCAERASDLVADLGVGRCVATDAAASPRPHSGSQEALHAALAEAGRQHLEAIEALDGIHKLLAELAAQCGLQEELSQAGGTAIAEMPSNPEGDEQQEHAGDGGGVDGHGSSEGGDAVAGDDADADVSAAGLPAQTGVPVQTARLLSFVVGGIGAAAALEDALTVRGAQLHGNSEEPSMAFPISAYGFGCAALRPWGTSWACPREDVVVFVVHPRATSAIMRRIAAGMDDAGAEAAGN
uniref:Uncharacterized protein n=1 Tax=Pyrodinium bahamense TaxID=73915 RepID=A0A7S0A3B4_9DINO